MSRNVLRNELPRSSFGLNACANKCANKGANKICKQSKANQSRLFVFGINQLFGLYVNATFS